MTESQSKMVETAFGSAMASVEAADAAFAYAVQLEGILCDLQTETRQSYGQFCGLARALEVVGERWALLIVRDLLVGPRRFVELQRGLPGVPVNVLSTRLAELEQSGVIRRRAVAHGDETWVYELTERGRGLEDIVLSLGRWGVAFLGTPRATDIVTTDSVIMAMRTAFRPEVACGQRVGFELRLAEFVIHVRVEDGRLEAAAGPLPGADLVIEPGQALKGLLTGEVSPAQVLADGSVRIVGEASLLSRFVELFRVS